MSKFYLYTFLFQIIASPIFVAGQQASEWGLEKFPVDLETDFALSALPSHLRKDATIYLLDPKKGYYLSHKGSNGFMCFVARTEWEWGVFRKDIATPVSYDAAGTIAIFSVYQDVESMRASGKFTALQIKDSVIARIIKGIYKAPSPGISYMLAPIMRTYAGNPGSDNVITMSGPHYMFYAPYLTNEDIGNIPHPQHEGPIVINNGSFVMGERKGSHGYIIVPAGLTEKAKIINENKELMKRLEDYKSYFKVADGSMNHK